MAIYGSPWAGAGAGMADAGSGLGALLLQKKLMDIQQAQYAQQQMLARQQMGLREREFEAQLPLWRAQNEEAMTRIPLIREQTEGAKAKRLSMGRTEEEAGLAGQAQSLYPIVTSPTISPELKQPAASQAIQLLMKAGLFQPQAQPTDVPASSVGEMLSALMRGKLTGLAAEASPGALLRQDTLRPGERPYDFMTQKMGEGIPSTTNDLGFAAAPWGTFSRSTGQPAAQIPRTWKTAEQEATGSAQLGALGRKVAVGEPLSPQEIMRWRQLLRIQQQAPDGIPRVSTQEDFDALQSGETYIGEDGVTYQKP